MSVFHAIPLLLFIKIFIKGAEHSELECPGRGPKLHLPGPAGGVLLHPRGQHQGVHLAGAARQDTPDHQGESRPAQGEDQAPGWSQKHQYQGNQKIINQKYSKVIILSGSREIHLPMGQGMGR